MEKNEKKESLEEMFAVLEKTVNQMETEELSLAGFLCPVS